MRISFMNYTRTLNISGERPIDSENDKWVRFNQSYPIPLNCEEAKLQANFAHGILAITMPKKILSKTSPKTEAKRKGQEPRPDGKAHEDIPQKAQDKPTVPRLEEQKPEKAQEKIPQEYAPPRVEELKPGPQEKISQKHWPDQVEEPRPNKVQERLEGPKPEKAHEHIPQGSTPRYLEEQKPDEAHEEEIPFKFRIRRGKEDLSGKSEEADERGLKALGPQEPTKESRPKKGQYEETKPTLTTIKPQRKPIDETEQRPTLKVPPKKPKNEKPEKGAEEPEKMLQEKEIRTRKSTTETAGKEKEIFPTKEDIVSTIGKGIRQVSASTSEVVTKISEGKWKEEEKPMLVNMGAAFLVIAALGVYVSYKINT